MKAQRVAQRGAVGRRVVTCLQTIDIGRLTSDPVFLVPGGFIAVTGQGPLDSNESSKTTFEAALSLVHGDPGWRQTSPQFSAYATELLFNPPNAPVGSRVRADVGFVVAVFVGTGDTYEGTTAEDDHLTVWVRIRRHDDPSFEVAATPGVRLARGSNHAARIEDANECGPAFAARSGDPRCIRERCSGLGLAACRMCQLAGAAANSARPCSARISPS